MDNLTTNVLNPTFFSIESWLNSSEEDYNLETIASWLQHNAYTSPSNNNNCSVTELKGISRPKLNLWRTSWGNLLLSENTKDITTFEGKKFLFTFRITFQMFKEYLIPLCKRHFQIERHSYIPLEFKILISLRLLASDEFTLNIGDLSSISRSTLTRHFQDFVSEFILIKKHNIESIPKKENFQKITETYSKIGFPGCCGSKDIMDFNWGELQSHTLSMEVIVDHTGYINYISKVSNNMTRKESFLTKTLLSGILHDVTYTMYNNNGIPVPCRGGYLLVKNSHIYNQCFMKPIDPQTNEYETHWNYFQNSIQEDPHNVFQIMKSRWRILESHHFRSYTKDFVQNVIHTCCILNNISITYDSIHNTNWENTSPNMDDNDIYTYDPTPHIFDQERPNFDVIKLEDEKSTREYRTDRLTHFIFLQNDLVTNFKYQYMYELLRTPNNVSPDFHISQKEYLRNANLKIPVPLYVKESTIKYGVQNADGSMTYTGNCRKGLFCTRDIKDGEHIATYKGKMQKMTKSKAKALSKTNGYLLRYKKNRYLNCKYTRQRKQCLASYANTARNAWNTQHDKEAKNNSKIINMYTTKTIDLCATENIMSNTEILVPYGNGHHCGVQCHD